MMPRYSFPSRNTGFSLVELMVAAAIGMLLLAGLSMIFVNSSAANRELQKTAQQIENGRYSVDILTQDLHHAGYYGHLAAPPAAPVSLPDPCEVTDTAKLTSALALPVQGYQAADLSSRPDISGTSCGSSGAGAKNLLTTANLKPGSDILVVRRVNTQALTGNSVNHLVYLQATNTTGLVRIGDGSAFSAVAGMTKKDGTQSPVRRYVTHVYFVAPCSAGSGTNGVCQSGDDSIPTLKRLELSATSSATVMQIVPLVEGVDFLKIEYGIDTIPAAINPITGVIGDSTVDSYVASSVTVGGWSAADWGSVIGARVYVLARNTEATMGYVDNKTYTLGSVSVSPIGDSFKRHAYASTIRMINPAGRREIP